MYKNIATSHEDLPLVSFCSLGIVPLLVCSVHAYSRYSFQFLSRFLRRQFVHLLPLPLLLVIPFLFLLHIARALHLLRPDIHNNPHQYFYRFLFVIVLGVLRLYPGNNVGYDGFHLSFKIGTFFLFKELSYSR